MWSLNWRGWSPNTPCEEYEKLQVVAEDLLAHVDASTSPEQFEQAQKGLLFYWEERKKHLDPLHPRFPGGHRCLDDAYLHYAMLLRARAVLQKEQTAAVPPGPIQPPLTPDAVVNNLRTLAKDQTRRRDTYLGEEVWDPPSESTE
jgi:hypothetical protein